MRQREGKVYLVGAGPGDPGLLTLRGKECLELADVVIVDYLVNPSLLTYPRPGTECIWLGGRGTSAHRDQEAINALLVQHAQAGRQVVRLKNGDPFLFGRGAEEAEALAANGIVFEVVPGVTSAVACPAYLGIPLTHRRYASQVTIVTAHEDPAKAELGVDWTKLASGSGTLVILMGLRTIPSVLEFLKTRGMAADTPVAVIGQGTLLGQQALIGTLDEIGPRVATTSLQPPVMAVIGEVVRLGKQLCWFHPEAHRTAEPLGHEPPMRLSR